MHFNGDGFVVTEHFYAHFLLCLWCWA